MIFVIWVVDLFLLFTSSHFCSNWSASVTLSSWRATTCFRKSWCYWARQFGESDLGETPPEPPRWHWRRRSSLRWPPPVTDSVDEKGRKATYSIPILTFRLKIKRKTCSSPILMVSSDVSLVVPSVSRVSTTKSCLEYRVPSWCSQQWSRGGGGIIAWCSTWRTPSPLMLILVLAWDILSKCSWRVASFEWDLFRIFD